MMASSPSSSSISTSSISTSPTKQAYPAFLRPYNNARKSLDDMTVREVRTELKIVEREYQAGRSPQITENLGRRLKALRARLMALEEQELLDSLTTTHLTPDPSSSPPRFLAGNAPVVMRTKAMAVARPLTLYGSAQHVPFAEGAPLEQKGNEWQLERQAVEQEWQAKKDMELKAKGLSREDAEIIHQLRKVNGTDAKASGVAWQQLMSARRPAPSGEVAEDDFRYDSGPEPDDDWEDGGYEDSLSEEHLMFSDVED